MLHRLRSRAADEAGFSLVQLLVVVLIIGILAAIALPSFLAQKRRAEDTQARADARTAQTAQEAWYTQEATYTSTIGDLEGLEQSLVASTLTSVTGDAGGYTVAATASSGNVFAITRAADGSVTRTCTTAGQGACPADGTW